MNAFSSKLQALKGGPKLLVNYLTDDTKNDTCLI